MAGPGRVLRHADGPQKSNIEATTPPPQPGFACEDLMVEGLLLSSGLGLKSEAAAVAVEAESFHPLLTHPCSRSSQPEAPCRGFMGASGLAIHPRKLHSSFFALPLPANVPAR